MEQKHRHTGSFSSKNLVLQWLRASIQIAMEVFVHTLYLFKHLIKQPNSGFKQHRGAFSYVCKEFSACFNDSEIMQLSFVFLFACMNSFKGVLFDVREKFYPKISFSSQFQKSISFWIFYTLDVSVIINLRKNEGLQHIHVAPCTSLTLNINSAKERETNERDTP